MGFPPVRVLLLSILLITSRISQAQDSLIAQDLSLTNPGATNLEQLKKLSLEDLMSLRVATVTTASKMPEKATDAPSTAIVIDQNDIKLRGYSNLVDVLRDLPGMDLSENFFSELGTQVSVRGITGNNRIVVLVNGMRVNPPGGEYFPFRSDFSVRNAEQIEVIYGPGSTLYGQDAISAVINVKTKTPPSDGRWMIEGGAEGGFHVEREFWGNFGKVISKADNIVMNGFIQYHNSELSRFDKEYPSWWQDFRSVAQTKRSGVVPKREDYGLNAFFKLDVGDFYIQSWYRLSERSSAEGYGPPTLGFIPEAKWRDQSWVTEAKHIWKLSDKVTLDSSATFNYYEVLPQSRYVEALDVNHWFLDDFKYARGHSLNIEETLRFSLSDSVSALLGVGYTSYDIIPKSTVPGGAKGGDDASIIQQGGSFTYFTEAGNPASIHQIPRVVAVDFSRYGAYAEMDWKISPKLKAVLGGRVEKDSRIETPAYTPRGALIYQINHELTARYSYSWAYISPAPYFGFSTYDRGDILNTSNPGLKPELSKTHELGLNYNKDSIDIGLTAYYGTQSSLILVSDVGSQPNILLEKVFLDLAGTQPRTLTHTVNSGTSHNFGVDFYGKFKITRDLSTWYSYSYTTFEAMTAGRSSGLNGISNHNFRLGFTWAITPRLFVTPSLIARSTPENVNAGKLGSELHNPWEINLHLLYKATDSLEIYAGLSNITNNHNATTALLPTALPQETFGGVLGVRYTY